MRLINIVGLPIKLLTENGDTNRYTLHTDIMIG